MKLTKEKNKSILCKVFFILFYIYFFNNISFSQNQLLWKISGNGLKKDCYIYGSFHSNNPKIFNFPDSLYYAFFNTDILALEADLYPMFVYEDVRKTKPKLRFDVNGNIFSNETDPSQTKYGNENGRPQFLDMHFQIMAQNSKKQCFFLETIEEQLEIFENLYEESNYYTKIEEYTQVENKFINAYIKGNIEEIRLYVEKELKNSVNAYERIINQRNIKITEKLDSIFKKKSTLTIIGAAHLSGQNGVLNLLKKKGYIIKPVKTSYTLTNEQINERIFPLLKFKYYDNKYKYSAVLGSKPYIDTNSHLYRAIYVELGQGNTYIIEIEKVKNIELKSIVNDIIMKHEESKIHEIKHQDTIIAYEGIGYEYNTDLCWKRVFLIDNKLVKLICYGGNKFMCSNRPRKFFDSVIFE